jgi:hypothetical protein
MFLIHINCYKIFKNFEILWHLFNNGITHVSVIMLEMCTQNIQSLTQPELIKYFEGNRAKIHRKCRDKFDEHYVLRTCKNVHIYTYI